MSLFVAEIPELPYVVIERRHGGEFKQRLNQAPMTLA